MPRHLSSLASRREVKCKGTRLISQATGQPRAESSNYVPVNMS